MLKYVGIFKKIPQFEFYENKCNELVIYVTLANFSNSKPTDNNLSVFRFTQKYKWFKDISGFKFQLCRQQQP